MPSMSQLYARVFVQILDSSISEDFTCRHVFEDLLKLCDYRSGVVDVTREALSRRLNIPLEILEKAINKLESPDSKSRDQDFGGRRIIRLDDHRNWGWRIANWEKYDKIKRRVDVAMRVAKHRASKPPAKEPHQSAEEIYQAYPLKVAKQVAIQAITKQLANISPEVLLAATREFAKAWESSPDKTFCPHPATWFNQQRFNDSPETWKPNHGNNQKPKINPRNEGVYAGDDYGAAAQQKMERDSLAAQRRIELKTKGA